MKSTVQVYSRNTRIDCLVNSTIRLNKNVVAVLDRYLESGKIMAICLSGGPDSMYVLIHCINYLRKKSIDYRKKCKILHYMHHVREDSDIDFLFIRKLSESLGIPYSIASYFGSDFREEVLRNARRDRIDYTCQLSGVDIIISGHMLNDRIETTLINSIRGCNMLGLNGMKMVTKRTTNIVYMRPLLSICKNTIKEFLKTYAIPHLIDYTNNDITTSERNRIRKVLKNEGFGIYNKKRREKFYILNSEGLDTKYTILSCDTHPDRGRGSLIKLVGVWGSDISLSQILLQLGVSCVYSHTQNCIRKKFILTHGFGMMKLGNSQILRTNNTLYYTTFNGKFWKIKKYGYNRCKGVGWKSPLQSYQYENTSFKRRMKRNVPIFWRNCLPVLVKNNTVQKIYPLIR